MASDEVIDPDSHEGILGEYFDFGDGLILPDKPFNVKKELTEYHGEHDFDFGHGGHGIVGEDSTDFFMGATPSPSSSSTTSSSAVASAASTNSRENAAAAKSRSNIDLAMAIADDFMNIDFSTVVDAAADVDIGDLDQDLDFLQNVVRGDRSKQFDNNEKSSKVDKKSLTKKKSPSSSLMIPRRDDVEIFTDLNAPLTQIRQQVEERFGLSLTDFGIWLQDTTVLDDRSTLSEQCIEGQGVVKVKLNVQPVNSDGNKKINIIDVLKVDPDMMVDKQNSDRSTDDEDDDFFDEDDDIDVESATPPTSAMTLMASDDPPMANFIESVEFNHMRKRFSYPMNMTHWSRLHTLQWAKWANRTFKGVSLNEEHWSLDGQELAVLSEEDFTLMVGYDPGNLLWSHFSVLRQTGMATVPAHLVPDLTSHRATAVVNSLNNRCSGVSSSSVSNKRTFDTASAVNRAVAAAVGVYPPPPKKQRVILGKYEEAKVFINSEDSSSGHRSGNNGNNVQLWKFLLDILTDYRHRNIIRWSLGDGTSEGEFIMCEPEGVARLWGQQKGKVTMNYEKLSRALRYYKGGNILDKVHNKKFTYRFVCDLRDIVGFSATELDQRVRDQVEAAAAASGEFLS